MIEAEDPAIKSNALDRKKLIFWLVIGIVLLVAAGILIYVFFFQNPTKEDGGSTTSDVPCTNCDNEEDQSDDESNTDTDIENVQNGTDQQYTNINGHRVLTFQGIETAQAAISAGTKIIDQTGDWTYTGNPEDNSSPYPIDFIDIKEVDIGIDENNLYVMGIFNGVWPESAGNWPIYNGDQVSSTSFSVAVDSDNNSETGCQADGGTEMTFEVTPIY